MKLGELGRKIMGRKNNRSEMIDKLYEKPSKRQGRTGSYAGNKTSSDEDHDRGWKIMKKALAIFAIILVVSSLGASFYFYNQYRVLKSDNNQKEINTYVKQLEKMVILPEEESPTLATVTNREKLVGQLFFTNAQNGDKVLLFSNSRKAILFRPKENKIVEMMILSGNLPEELSEGQK